MLRQKSIIKVLMFTAPRSPARESVLIISLMIFLRLNRGESSLQDT